MDIGTIRFLWGTFACWLVIFFLFISCISGIKSGKFHCGDPTSVCSKDKNPRKFWLLIALFSFFTFFSFVVWMKMVVGMS